MSTQIEIKKIREEIKEKKETKETKEDFLKIFELLRASKTEAEDTRFCLLLLAIRDQKGFYPFEKELEFLLNHALAKTIFLTLIPELNTLKTMISNTVSLLDAICLMWVANLGHQAMIRKAIQSLIKLNSDTAKIFISLLKWPDLSNSESGLRLLNILIPAIQSCHTEIFQTILRFGTKNLLAKFIDEKYEHRKRVLEDFSTHYQPGNTTYFHQLCDIESFAQVENRFQMIVLLASIPAFKTIQKKLKETKEAKEIKEKLDILNAKDSQARAPLDFAVLWAQKEHVNKLVEVGMTACDDVTSLYRFFLGKNARTFGIAASECSGLFPKRTKDMIEALSRNTGQFVRTEGNFGSSFFPVQCGNQTLSIKRLYSPTKGVANEAINIWALGSLSKAVVPLLALDADDKNHLLIGTQYMSAGSLERCLKAPASDAFAKKLQARDEVGYVLRLQVAVEIAATLALFHKKDFIHGDIQPKHILLHESEGSNSIICKLTGLDLSPSAHDTPNQTRLDIWSAGWRVEQNAFPPELHSSVGSNHVTNYTLLTDVYSLGAILDWMFYFDFKRDAKKTEELKQIIELAMSADLGVRITSEKLHSMLASLLGKNENIAVKQLVSEKTEQTQLPTPMTPINFDQFFDKLQQNTLKSFLENIKTKSRQIFSNVPKPTFPFIGRDREVSFIKKYLIEKARVVLLGEPGMGTTTVAAEYCHANRSEYNMIVWLSLNNMPNMVEVYKALIQINPNFAFTLLNNETSKLDPITQLHSLLIQFKPSLLVLDDVAADHVHLYAPPLNSGVHCLVTSQSESYPSSNWQDYKQIELRGLELGSAHEFFESDGTVRTDYLSAVLGHSPFLLTMSTAYSQLTKITADSFLAFLYLQMKASSSFSFADECGRFLIQQLPLLDKSQTATDLLGFIALMAPTNIPTVWFKTFLKRLGKSEDEITRAITLLQDLKLIIIKNEEVPHLKSSYCSMHPVLAHSAVVDLITRKTAERLVDAACTLLKDYWNGWCVISREKLITHGILLLLPHTVHFVNKAMMLLSKDKLEECRKHLNEVTTSAKAIGDSNLALFLKNKMDETPKQYELPFSLPSRLKIPDYSSDIFKRLAYFNKESKENVDLSSPITDYLTIYLRNLREHYAPLRLRNEHWDVFFNMICDYLKGGFFVGTAEERIKEKDKREREFLAEFRLSKQHSKFELATHCHSHLIRICAKLANFLTAHYRGEPDFEQGILQLFDISDAFGASGDNLLNRLAEHEYGIQEIPFCFRRFDGEHHSNSYRIHPSESTLHRGLFSFKIKGPLLRRNEMEEANRDALIRQSGCRTFTTEQMTEGTGVGPVFPLVAEGLDLALVKKEAKEAMEGISEQVVSWLRKEHLEEFAIKDPSIREFFPKSKLITNTRK